MKFVLRMCMCALFHGYLSVCVCANAKLPCVNCLQYQVQVNCIFATSFNCLSLFTFLVQPQASSLHHFCFRARVAAGWAGWAAISIVLRR